MFFYRSILCMFGLWLGMTTKIVGPSISSWGLRSPLKGSEDLPRGLNALLKGCKDQGAPSPERRLNQLLEASRAQSKYLNTLTACCLSHDISGTWRAINTTLESLLKTWPIQYKPYLRLFTGANQGYKTCFFEI